MTPFKFSLEQLLHLKRRVEQQAELAQAAARMAEHAAAAKLAELEQELADSAAHLTVGRGVGSPSGLGLVTRLGDAVRDAGRELDQAARRRQAADDHRAGVAVEVEALRELRQRQLAAHRLQDQRSEREKGAEAALRYRSRLGEQS